MQISYNLTAKKGRLSLSINQNILDRLEPYKHLVNFSAKAEQLLAEILEELESLAWVDRNADALAIHGKEISATGLAGAEFDRI